MHVPEHDFAADRPSAVTSLYEGPHRGGVDERDCAEIDPDPRTAFAAQSVDAYDDVRAIGAIEFTGAGECDGRWRRHELARAGRRACRGCDVETSLNGQHEATASVRLPAGSSTALPLFSVVCASSQSPERTLKVVRGPEPIRRRAYLAGDG